MPAAALQAALCTSPHIGSLAHTSQWQAAWLDHSSSFSTQIGNKWNVSATRGNAARSEKLGGAEAFHSSSFNAWHLFYVFLHRVSY